MGEANIEKTTETNDHVRSFIGHYSSIKAPGYAVLITGAWGVGKTHLLRDVLPWDDEDPKSVYVSLFGLKNSEEVFGALYAKIDPKGSGIKKVLSGVGEAVKGVSLFGVGIGGAGTALTSMASSMITMNLSNEKVIIFDDLERSRLSLKTIMGVLNQLVEHLGFRVIVVAHDEKLASDFVLSKEKTFGQTLSVYPQVDKALASFVADIADEAVRAEVSSFADAIKLTFKNGDFGSLRLLRHGVNDIARLTKCIEDRFKNNRIAMFELITTFLAFDLEIRSGNINKNLILNQRNKLLSAAMKRASGKSVDDDAQRLQAMHEKYKNVNIENGLLSEKFLYDALVNGMFDARELSTSLENSAYFIAQKDMPAWRRVIDFDSTSDEETKIYVKMLENDFRQRTITNFGDMFHTFSLRLLLANRREIKKTVKTVERECKAYIDAMSERGVLAKEIMIDWLDMQLRNQGAHGFSFWVDTGCADAFKNIVSHFEAAAKKSIEGKYPDLAKALVSKLSESPGMFASSISYMGDGKHEFAEVPVLRVIKPRRFAKDLIASPRQDNGWHIVRTALELRYSGGTLEAKLSSEKKWLAEVIAALRKEAENVNGLARLRIERLIPRIEV